MTKAIAELNFPEGLWYTAEHLWVGKTDGICKAGITDFAQDRLGEIVFVDLPERGDHFDKGETFGTVESLKTVSDLYMPVSGTIKDINEIVSNSPQIVNGDPYGNGWMISIVADYPVENTAMLGADEYIKANS